MHDSEQPRSVTTQLIQGAPRTRLLVLGMHRSGTSTTTEVLKTLGFHVGDGEELTNPSWQNPRGFFERRDLRELCDALLIGSGADWWKVSNFDPNAVNADVVNRVAPKIRNLVNTLDKNGQWVVKEPRLCLLLPLMLPFIRNPAVVLVIRHPAEVAQSLRRRNGFPTVSGTALWEAYVGAALNHTNHLPRVIVDYRELVLSPAHAISRISTALTQMGFNVYGEFAEAIKVVDESLYREHVGDAEEVMLSPSQSRLWDALKSATFSNAAVRLPRSTLHVLRQFELDEEQRREQSNQILTLKTKLADQKSGLAAQTEEIKRLNSVLERKTFDVKEQTKAHATEVKRHKHALAAETLSAKKSAVELSKANTELARLGRELEAKRAQVVRQGAVRRELMAKHRELGNKYTELRRRERHVSIALDRTIARRVGRLFGKFIGVVSKARTNMDLKEGQKRQINKIKKSKLFMRDWYKEQYLQADPKVDPIAHYVREGAENGNDPSPYFDSKWYLSHNADIDLRGLSPLAHFIIEGARNGASPNPSFDTRAYMEKHPKLASSQINPLRHFMKARRSREAKGKVDSTEIALVNLDRPQDLARHAQTLVKSQSWQALIDLWRPIAEMDKAPASAVCGLIRAYRAAGDARSAMEWALRGQAAYPRDVELAEECVRAAIACDEKKSAEQIFSRISDSLGSRLSAELHLAMAKRQRSWGDHTAAERTLKRGLIQYAANAALEAELAAGAMDRNHWADAETLWAAALLHSDDAPQAGIFLGLAASLRAQGKIEKAIGIVAKGLDALPGNDGLTRTLWELEISRRNWREAVEQWVDQNSVEFGDAMPLVPDFPSLAQAPSDKKIVVYTCMFGAYEAPKEPLIRDPRVRWVLFTDNATLQSSNWDVVHVSEILGTARRSSRLPKILPHVYLGEHDISIYVDASLEVKTPDIVRSCELMLGSNDVALYKHHARDNVLDEIDFVEQSNLEHPDICAWYRELYSRIGIEKSAGLFENTLIVRRNTVRAKTLNERWWYIYSRAGGERDQLSFMAALKLTGVAATAIAQGRQVRDNMFVNFYRHYRPPLPFRNGHTFIFIPYAPAEYGRDLGRTYNDYMARLEDDDIAIFLDHDAMLCGTQWLDRFAKVAANYSDREVVIFGRCNRIGSAYQRLPFLSANHDLDAHDRFAEAVFERYHDSFSDITYMTSASGVVFAITKRAWEKNKFTPGLMKVDNNLHKSLRGTHGEVLLAEGLYVYHFYRADGDMTHVTENFRGRTDASDDKHFLRNVVHASGAHIDVAAYIKLLRDGDWMFFVEHIATFCTKDWYLECSEILKELPESSVLVPRISLFEPNAPQNFDVIAHRQFASELRREGPRSSRMDVPDLKNVPIFAISRAMLEQVILKHPASSFTAMEIANAAFALGAEVVRANFAYALVKPETAEVKPERLEEPRRYLMKRRNIGLLTLGFWPQQAGMEMFIHNLAGALITEGDLVTLFAPVPDEAFEEIRHTYILRRFRDVEHLIELFRISHVAFPFDAIIVQGADKAATLALELKAAFGVPVILRTHGEDIQADPSIGYGYRLDPARAELIDNNVRAADWNVAISRHVENSIKNIAPNTPTAVIGNGVDTERFSNGRSDYLRETLGIPGSELIILTVGRNVRKKSLHFAVQALHDLRHRGCAVVLVHAGKPGNAEDLGKLAEKSGVGQYFYAMGEVSYFDIPKVYCSADIFVFPSKLETFGNVTIEAMASGLPCVEFDYAANADKIDNGTTGYIVPYGDLGGFVDRIDELVKDPALRRRIGDCAREAARERFGWQSVAEKYREVVRAVSNKAPTRRRLVSSIEAGNELDALISV